MAVLELLVNSHYYIGCFVWWQGGVFDLYFAM